MVFVLPPKSQVGYLHPDIAGEGENVLMSDGSEVSWTPPPPQPIMPDWSQIKSIRKYFGRKGHQTWPCWLYHPVDAPRLLKNEHDAAELGVCYRPATADETARTGAKHVWDWKDDCQWRPTPFPKDIKFDPLKAGPGKTFQPAPVNPAMAEEAMILKVAAAVGAALKLARPGGPATVDAKQWDDFLAFQAWQKTQEIVKAETANALLIPDAPEMEDSDEDEYGMWLVEAEGKGVKVDKRWGLARLKEEVEKAA